MQKVHLLSAASLALGLAYCTTAPTRVDAARAWVADARDLEATLNKAFAAGIASQADVLGAKYYRLEAEMALAALGG